MISGRKTTGRPKKLNYRSGRDKKLCIRLSDRDLRMLNKVSEFFGMTKTDFLIERIWYGVKEMERISRLNSERRYDAEKRQKDYD